MTHGCFLPILQLHPHFSSQVLGAVTVDCAQVWLARPQESTEKQESFPTRDSRGGTHRDPGCCHCRHTPPVAPSKGESCQTFASRKARATGAGTTEWLSQGLARPRGCRPSVRSLLSPPRLPAMTPSFPHTRPVCLPTLAQAG